MAGPVKRARAREQGAAPGQRDLEAGFGFFRGGARPPTSVIVAFIDANREELGVEPICRVLTEHTCRISPSGYYAAKSRPPSARAVRDDELKAEITRVYEENLFVYGADKIWTQLNREGTRVARCTVEHLMGDLGIAGARRGRTWTKTTQSDDRLGRPADLVDPPAPNRLWVADITLREDPHRMGVPRVRHRRVLPHGRRLAGVTVAALGPGHRRPQDGLVVTGPHRGPRPARPSLRPRGPVLVDPLLRTPRRRRDRRVGRPKGDSYDNALAESFNGLYKWELIYRHGPWQGLADVEFATLTYVDWFNQRRLHGEIGMIPPVEREAAHYRQNTPATEPVTQ